MRFIYSMLTAMVNLHKMNAFCVCVFEKAYIILNSCKFYSWGSK